MFRCCGAAAVDVEQQSTAERPGSLPTGKSVLLMSNPRSNVNTAWLKVRVGESSAVTW
jgi:secreted Zn-dependent insulinase-like peptidase